MELRTPFGIGPRLLPELVVGDGRIALEHVGCKGNRLVYRWYIDIPAGEYSEADLSSPRDDTQAMFGTLLAFLGACGEGCAYQLRTGRQSENADLFPAPVAEWAYQHSDELGSLREEIESTPGLIAG